jgi:hypothetical protein
MRTIPPVTVRHPAADVFVAKGARTEVVRFAGIGTPVTPSRMDASLLTHAGNIGDMAPPWCAGVFAGPGGLWSPLLDLGGSRIRARDLVGFLACRPVDEDAGVALDRAFAGTPVGAWWSDPHDPNVPDDCFRGEPEASFDGTVPVHDDRDDARRHLLRFLSDEVAIVDGWVAMRVRPLLALDVIFPASTRILQGRPPLPATVLPVRPDMLEGLFDVVGEDAGKWAVPGDWLAMAGSWPDEPDDALAILDLHAAGVALRLRRCVERMRKGAEGRLALVESQREMVRLTGMARLGRAGRDDLQGDLDAFLRALTLCVRHGGYAAERDGLDLLRRYLVEIVAPRAIRTAPEDEAALSGLAPAP